ncbi:sodium:proton antiporter [Planctomycetaceae bacterium SH139]
MSVSQFLGLYNYWIVVFLMMTGFYIVISSRNLVKSIIGLNIFQTSVFLLYISMGKVNGATAPIIPPSLVAGHAAHGPVDEHAADHASDHIADKSPAGGLEQDGDEAHEHAVAHGDSKLQRAMASGEITFSNPLPSVLMLTAIVVGIATTALALALIVRIREDYGSIEEDEILELDRNS